MKPVCHLGKHLTRELKEEIEVRRLQTMTDKEEKAQKLGQLRRKGNNEYNLGVVRKKEGLLHLTRAPADEKNFDW